MQRARDIDARLIRLRDRVEPAVSFRITQGNWQTLRAAIEATPYDGATNFGAFTPDVSIDEYLLVSDGLANFGESNFPATRVPVHTVLSAIKADPVVLRFIAERSGGRFVDLAGTTASDAVASILASEERIDSIASNGATDLLTGSRFPQQGYLTIAGVLREPSTVIMVRLVSGKTPRTIEVPINAASKESTVAPWLWARTRLGMLEGEASLHRGEIRRLGQHFGIPTSETSLIILDRVADYVRYEIDPPPELRDEYERMRAASVRTTTMQKRGQIDRVAAMMKDKEAWWNRVFPKGDRPQVQVTPKAGVAAGAHAGEHLEHRRESEGSARDRMPQRPASAPALADSSRPMASGAISRLASAPAQAEQDNMRQTIAIQLKAWLPDAPYAQRLREARAEDLYRVYLDERPSFTTSTAFFLDAADVFFGKSLNALGTRVLSKLAWALPGDRTHRTCRVERDPRHRWYAARHESHG